MAFFSSVFGLSVQANHPIPGLAAQPVDEPADTQFWLDPAPFPQAIVGGAAEPWYVSAEREGTSPALQVWKLDRGAHYRLLYSDGNEFLVNGSGTEVRARWPQTSTLSDTATYLLGPVLGFVLRLRGTTCLHASAVAVRGRAIALLGPANAGKSTTAAAFARLGYPVLADDIVALSERDRTVYVEPSYPQLRLWPDSVEWLFGAADALPWLTPTWDKRALDLREQERFQQDALPLAAVYLLAGRSGGGRLVEGLHGRESLLTLLAHTYVGYLLDARMRGEEFEALGRLMSTVPVRRVVPSADPHLLPQLCGRILEDSEALGCTALPTTAR